MSLLGWIPIHRIRIYGKEICNKTRNKKSHFKHVETGNHSISQIFYNGGGTMIKENNYWKPFVSKHTLLCYQAKDERMIYINPKNEVILIYPSGIREVLIKRKKTYIYEKAVKVMEEFIRKDIEERRSNA